MLGRSDARLHGCSAAPQAPRNPLDAHPADPRAVPNFIIENRLEIGSNQQPTVYEHLAVSPLVSFRFSPRRCFWPLPLPCARRFRLTRALGGGRAAGENRPQKQNLREYKNESFIKLDVDDNGFKVVGDFSITFTHKGSFNTDKMFTLFLNTAFFNKLGILTIDKKKLDGACKVTTPSHLLRHTGTASRPALLATPLSFSLARPPLPRSAGRRADDTGRQHLTCALCGRVRPEHLANRTKTIRSSRATSASR